MTKTVLGIFTERMDAEEAINKLKDDGYDPKDISIVMRDKAQGDKLAEETGSDVVGGAVSGATTGALLGGLAGLLASFAIPGLGAFFVGGPIASALGLTGVAATTTSGAATGALAGGLIGALTGLGLTEDEARLYEERVKEGAILVAVLARTGDERIVEQIIADCNASDVKVIAQDREATEKFTTLTNDRLTNDDAYHHHSYAGAKGGSTSRRKNK